jgi:predicted HicB family RNase H-like nuclease
MAAHKAEEPKKVYTYRAKPSVVKKASKKAKASKTTLSTKIESLINEYAN